MTVLPFSKPSVRIAVDIREACRIQPAGKGQWVRGCLPELMKAPHDWVLLTDAPVPAALAVPATTTVVTLPGGALWHWRAARWLRRQQIDLYFSPTSFLVPWLVGRSVRTVILIHDLIAFRSEPHAFKARWLERVLLPRVLRSAVGVFTLSKATSQDLHSHFPRLKRSPTVVYAGPLAVKPVPSVPDGQTILCPGTLCPRKNQLRLIRAYAGLPESLRSRYQLVLTGARGWRDADILRAIESTPGVVWRQYLPPAEYETLLQRCTVLAFPSLYEGFGLPALDALQRGIPLLTSRVGSLPEVASETAVYVDPLSEADIQRGLQSLLADPALQSRLRTDGPRQAAQFSWSRTAQTVLSALHAAALTE